jgi:phosphohistidine swiveling domain-containing protein
MSKASNLAALKAAGFNVPAFVIVPADLFAAFLAGVDQPPSAQRVGAAPWPLALAKQVTQIAGQLPNAQAALAVRSSMFGEDSERHSFAGQLDSFLNVSGEGALLEAVRACWASAFSERALAYRQQHGIEAGPVAMEVILQAMVPAEVSGVIFTADPVARDPRWLLISAAAGLGEGLVQGSVPGETYRVNRESRAIRGEGSVLGLGQIAALAQVAEEIEAHFGRPQDIEFALAGGVIWILQARPITVPIYSERMLWDNANITESYSGVTSPLTFSVIRGAYAQVYRQFLALMGVRSVDENVLRNLLGYYQGQVYYQLLNWYAGLALLPAFRMNRRFMEQMMGVKQSAGEQARRRHGLGEAVAVAAWLGRVLALHRTNERRVREFLDYTNAVLAEYRGKDLETMSPHQLRAAYLDLENRVLGRWQAPIVTDFFAMIFFGTLRQLSGRWLGLQGALPNDLLAGNGAIESLQPVRQVQAMARQVRDNPRLRALFALPDPADTLDRLRQQPESAALVQTFDDYLRLYGDRRSNELKLEEPSLRDDPAHLVRLIRSAAEHPAESSGGVPVRAEAEKRLAQLKFWQRPLFGWVLDEARRHVRDRENMRFQRARVFGVLRRLFNALGGQWAQAGLIERPSDIYYLTVSDIWDFVEGTATVQNLSGLVALRRAEQVGHAAAALPDRFETLGVPYLDQPRDLLARVESADGSLRGVGCCSGRVAGRARVVAEAAGLVSVDGDILAAERMDPGWVFLFPSASGILVERGSPLSHSVIVARELGKPIIVNIPGLTRLVKTGDQLEMDGALGIAWIRGQAASPAPPTPP